jgi:D-alanyl-D-alanine endopeptidase (penicillin-binding protein 7)
VTAARELGWHVNRKPLFWIGAFVLVGLFGISIPGAEAARKPKAPAKRTTLSAAAAKRALYSAVRARTRKAKLLSARASARMREMAETVLPRYKVDVSGALVPDVHAAAAIIYNPVTMQVLWEENSQSQLSIASITKVMTATVFLENNPDLTESVTITRSDVYHASTTYLRANDRVTTGDLLHLLLIPSDNAAARALARISGYGPVRFVQRMNEKAHELGLKNTAYADPSGLLSENVSSAYDMARLITHASNDERIASIMRTPSYRFSTAKNRVINFRTTNHLLGRADVDVRAAKTGFISKAGYCLATLLRLPQGGPEVAVVVLGARSNAGRFMETRNLFSWLSTKASTLLAVQPQVIQPTP